MDSVSHVAFSDEHSPQQGRFRSVALVSLESSKVETFEMDLKKLMAESDVTELKWAKVRNAKYRWAAEKMLRYVVENAAAEIFRIDVLMWDTCDRRHLIPNRCDISNLHRMHHHLYKTVLRDKWPDDAGWLICPDENTQMRWDDVQTFANYKQYQIDGDVNLYNQEGRITLRKKFNILEIQPCLSHERPLVQVADFFAGLMVFSNDNYELYEKWIDREIQSQQPQLFSEPEKPPLVMNSTERERCYLLELFRKLCSDKKLYVSLRTNRCLTTFKPEYPFSFWRYIPQHAADLAPVRPGRAAT